MFNVVMDYLPENEEVAVVTQTTARLPVILFSSLISPAQLHKGQSVGADAQITKPEFGGLTVQVREIIQARRQGA